MKSRSPELEANSDAAAQNLAAKPGYRAAFRAYIDSLDQRDAEARAKAEAKAESAGHGGDGGEAAGDPL